VINKSPHRDKILFLILSKSSGDEQYFSLRRLQEPRNERVSICVLPYEAITMADIIKSAHVLRVELNAKSKGELLLMSQNTCGFEILNVVISSVCFHKAILLEKLVVVEISLHFMQS
jgi:hypothetical protein